MKNNYINKVIELAQKEILTPTWGVTEQFFTVHEPLLRNGKPEVARVDETREEGLYYIYFPIKDQSYFFVLIIEKANDELKISGAYNEARVLTYLLIGSDSTAPDAITKRIGIKPTEVSVKGTPRRHGNGHYNTNMWTYEPQKDCPDELERKLAILLGHLSSHSAALAELSKTCEISINIVYHSYQGFGSLGGFHITNNIIKKIAKLDIGVDFDLYVSGPELEE